VLCVPDFVANCGGVLGGTMEFAGWQPAEIFAFYDTRFRGRVDALIRDAIRLGQPLRDRAESSSLERFAAVKAQAEQPSVRGTIVEAALAAYREGLIPGRLVRWMSDGYFGTRVG
jgi:glutamate dehydrogenase/leucine dehydrogenase